MTLGMLVLVYAAFPRCPYTYTLDVFSSVVKGLRTFLVS
jgi:hypothetical protein